MYRRMLTIVLVLLAGGLMLPAQGSAQTNECFAAAGSGGVIGDTRTIISGNAAYASANAGIHSAQFHLRLTIAADGTAEAQGVILLHDDPAVVGSATTGILAPYVPMLAIARQEVQATCADSDGDGTAGLERLEMTGHSVRSGDRVPVVLTATGEDIDDSGRYAIDLQIATETGSGEARVRLIQDRPGRLGEVGTGGA